MLTRIIVYLLAFTGGFSIMSIELLGGRLLAPYFGSSIHVWGSIITIFMLSLSIGYLAGGRLSLARPSLARFGAIFVVGAVCLYPLILVAEPVMNLVFEHVEDPRYGSLLAAGLLFVIPTAILGMISPYAVRLLVQATERAGHVAGILYFVSTLGSALGTLITSFYFVLWFEMNTILAALTAVLLGSGLLALAWAWRLRQARDHSAEKRAASAPASLALLLATLLGVTTVTEAEAQVIHRERSLYSTILVDRQGSIVCMQFSVRQDQRNQSCVDERNPNRLLFPYTRMMLTSLLVNPTPRRALMIGLGGGTLPGVLDQLYPELVQDVVEIDPAVTRVAREYFGFAPSDRVRVHEQDGRVFTKRAVRRGERYDLILLDAFNGEYIPEHLMTREFLAEVNALLADDGVLVANTFSISELYAAESATYAAIWPTFLNLKPDDSGNRVIIARKGPLPDPTLLAERARVLQPKVTRYDVKLETLIPLMTHSVDWPADTAVLTDQHSPANLLQGH